MEFDFNSYRQRLNTALGIPGQPADTSGLLSQGTQSTPGLGGMSQLQAPMESPASQLQQPQPIRMASNTRRRSRGKTPVGPKGWNPHVAEEKLAQVKTPEDLMAVLPKKDKDTYLDWWEQQHGNINEKYDELAQQAGAPMGKMSREEKFTLLMKFGLNLIRASSPAKGQGTGAAFAEAVGATGEQYLDDKERKKYEQRATLAEIENRRKSELEDIGTYGDALKSQSDLERTSSSIERDKVGMEADRFRIQKDQYEMAHPKESLIYGEGGDIYGYAGGGRASQITDRAGKPLKADPLRSARGAGGRPSVFSEKLSEWRSSHPLSEGASAEEKQRWNDQALAYASGKTGLTGDAVFLKALGQAQRELGNPTYYMGEVPYGEAVNARALEIYAGAQERGPSQPTRPGGPSPRSHLMDNDPLGLR